MKIKNVSTNQFAGIMDKDVNFSDGINVIYGKNESGKSTIVNLISRVLFQNSKVDGRKDKDFKEQFFPSAVKDDDFLADFADGKLIFEIDSQEYKLSKDWGEGARAMLTTPNGIIRDEKAINEILREKLLYGEGVYKDMLMPSQHYNDLSLQTILDSSQKTDAKQEITDVLSRAFVEGDGVSIDAIEEAIRSKIIAIRGEHWDDQRQAPERRSTRWKNGLGEILKVYYELEDAESAVEKITLLQDEADKATVRLNSQNEKIKVLEQVVAKLDGFSNLITLQKEYLKSSDRFKKELNKYESVLTVWPGLEGKIKKAKVLRQELKSCEDLELYNNAKQIVDELKAIDKSLLQSDCPTDEELVSVEGVSSKITSLQNMLCTMNIKSTIKMLADKNIEITSIRTGENIDFSEDLVLTEAVKITIDGVMEMILSPADVDAEKIESQIEALNNEKAFILKKYSVEDYKELALKAKSINDANSKYRMLNEKLSILMSDASFEELENSVKEFKDIRHKSEIEADAIAVCSTKDIERFINAKEAIVASYAEEYGSIDKLKGLAFDVTKELESVDKKLKEETNIPEELASIDDPESYLKTQRSMLKLAREDREEDIKTKAECQSKLEVFMQSFDGDPAENVKICKAELQEKIDLLQSWQNIYDEFLKQKDNISNNPFDDIASSFSKYLDIIANGRIESDFTSSDKLQMDIYSNNHLIDYDKLSEGTKETVSLAWRLAVVEHLFPNGGGVIVFDDPFTDMDIERANKSADLLKECAKRNQVIVLTCREEYCELLGGNVVKM